MADTYTLGDSYGRLLSAIKKSSRCAGVPAANRTASYYQAAADALEQIRRQVLADHAATDCTHARTIHAQLTAQDDTEHTEHTEHR